MSVWAKKSEDIPLRFIHGENVFQSALTKEDLQQLQRTLSMMLPFVSNTAVRRTRAAVCTVVYRLRRMFSNSFRLGNNFGRSRNLRSSAELCLT
jgi:hypothetical protein